MLSIREAISLYNTLSPFLPEFDGDDSAIDFAGKIVNAIKLSEKYDVYSDAIALMMQCPVEMVLKNSTPEESIGLFVNGLFDNKIFDLMRFMENLGWQKK